ncbi:MAG: hypothetical protein AAF399_10865 [Bacteroidota bacterium]
MNPSPSPEHDPLVQLIRQEVAGLEQTPSTEVWDRLDKRLTTQPIPSVPEPGGVISLASGLLAVASVSLVALAMWWVLTSPTSDSATSFAMSPSLDSIASPIPTLRERTPIPVRGFETDSDQERKAGISTSQKAETQHSSIFIAEKGGKVEPTILATPSQSLALPAISNLPFLEDTFQLAVIPPVKHTIGLLPGKEARVQTNSRNKKKRQLQLRIAWNDFLEDRKHWDYQVGARFSTANFTRRIMRPVNQSSSIWQGEVLGEWVPSHRIRLQAGLIFNRMYFDLQQQYNDQATIGSLIHALGIRLDPTDVLSISQSGRANALSIPLDVVVFLRDDTKSTQIWGSVGFQFNIWRSYRDVYLAELRVPGTNEVYFMNGSSGPLNPIAARFRFGIEQRLKAAHRIRISSFFQLPVGGNLVHRGLHDQVGISLGWFWASPNGPLRWRAKKGYSGR